MLKRGFSFAPGYRLEQFLGRGQFGQVWRASAPGGTAAAIKFIDLSDGEGEKEHAGIKRVKQIRHANLMPITAIWLLDADGKAIDETPDVSEETITFPSSIDPLATSAFAAGAIRRPEPAWLAVGMLLGGMSLQQRLRECVKNGLPGIPPKELLAYIDESAKGLDFLNAAKHDLGDGLVAIQHCDVKPANIVLIGSSAVVCDFGLARILSRNQVTATSASGTPAYMAPEAIEGKPSRTSDQYSLAVTYYHLRTGTLPISDGTVWEVLDAHRTGKLDLSRVSESEQAVLRRATSLHWEQRFESNGDFVESLREALRSQGLTHQVMPREETTDRSNERALTEDSLKSVRDDPNVTLIAGAASDARSQDNIDEEIPISIEGNEAWWLQPKWLAAGSIAIVAPMVLLVVFSEIGSKQARPEKIDDNSVVKAPEIGSDHEIDTAIASDVNSFEEEKASFDKAAKENPSLLDPQSTILAGLQGDVMHVAFLSDSSKVIAVGDRPEPATWDIQAFAQNKVGDTLPTVEPEKLQRAGKLIECLQLDPSGNRFAIADIDGNVAVHGGNDLEAGTYTVQLKDGDAHALAWSPDGGYLFAATSMPSIAFIDTGADDRSPIRFDLEDGVSSIAVDGRQQWIYLLSEKGMVSRTAWNEVLSLADSIKAPKLIDVTSAGSRVTKLLPTNGIRPEDSVLITGDENGQMILWSVDDETNPKIYQSHSAAITTLAASTMGIGGTIASGDDDGVVGLIRDHGQSDHGQSVYLAHRGAITSLAMSQDGRWLAASSLDGDVTVWDLSGEVPKMARLTSQAGPAHSLALDPNERWLVVGHSNGVVELWDFRHAKFIVKSPSLPFDNAPNDTPVDREPVLERSI